jgi:hypothetical protein|tara:strand:+ start:5164 stop:5373 length:210 start_codon:yes stop_codon:yes gene_type:complete
MASKDRDLINDPVDLAAERAADQEADISSRFLPTEHLRPVTRFLHEQGLTLKEMRSMADEARRQLKEIV